MSGAKLGVGALVGVALVAAGAALLVGGSPAPELILAPVPPETKDPTVALTGKARGPEGMALQLDGQVLRLAPAGPEGWRAFEVRAPLTEAGPHRFQLALSLEGQPLIQVPVEVTRIVEALAIVVDEPAEGTILSDPRVTIRGRIVGPVDLQRSRLMLDGERVDVGSDARFELTRTVRPGTQGLEFRLQGQQSAELVRTVHYDATSPYVEVYRPYDKYTTHATLKVVLRAWDEAASLTLKLGELEATVEPGTLWTGEVPVPEGESELKLELTDPAGNRYSRVLEVHRLVPQAIESKEFLQALAAESSSTERTRMIRRLDPNDQTALLTLVARCLTELEWQHSEQAVLALSSWEDQAKLRTFPGKNAVNLHKNPALFGTLIERLLLALGTAADPENVPTLIEFVDHEQWHLRRGAAAALERIPDARALQPLAAAFVKETHPLVKAAFERALQRISRHYEADPQAWLAWTQEHAVLGDPRAPTGFPELSDKRLVSQGIEWFVSARGPVNDAMPLLVFPDMGHDVSTVQPYFRELEEQRRVLYLQVPFPREPIFENGYTQYPFRKVAESLSALVKQLRQRGELPNRTLALFGAGHGGWLAAAYANADPVTVERQVLAATSPSSQTWFYAVRTLRDRFKPSMNMDLIQAGQRLSEPGRKPPLAFNQGGLNAICSYFSLQFANPKDPEIAHVVGPLVEKDLEGTSYRVYRGWRPLVGYKWTDFNLIKTGENTRTLLLAGERDPFFDEITKETLAAELAPPETTTFKRQLPWVVEVLPGCSRFPWVEQPELFHTTVRNFLEAE
ncbi:MAG: HEAT repeat domain-containing protein [Planctomycetota bacterium]